MRDLQILRDVPRTALRRSALGRLAVLAIAALPVIVTVTGCGGSSTTSTTSSTTSSTPATSSSSSSSASTATVSVGTVSGLGQVLVNGQGHTLYVFMPDHHVKVTCTGSCAQLWPPDKLSGSQQPTGSGAIKSSLLGSDTDPEGGRVVTYAGWPLYTYVGDSSSGQATGQGLETSGGLWYAISPAGVIVKKTP